MNYLKKSLILTYAFFVFSLSIVELLIFQERFNGYTIKKKRIGFIRNFIIKTFNKFMYVCMHVCI